MQNSQSLQKSQHNVEKLSLEIIRAKWSEAWGIDPHSRIGRTMLIRSLKFKTHEKELGCLHSIYEQRLKQLIRSYKRNSNCFEENQSSLKHGTRLVRDWNNERYSVLVQSSGYQYKDNIYSSLSQIAYEITGTRWNGWVFFGLKKKEKK